MMDVITGKTRPDSGSAFFGQSIDLTRLSEPEIAHAGIGRKFQKPTIFEQHSVFANLELAMKTDKRVRRSLFAWLRDDERDLIADTLRQIRLDGHAIARHRRGCATQRLSGDPTERWRRTRHHHPPWIAARPLPRRVQRGGARLVDRTLAVAAPGTARPAGRSAAHLEHMNTQETLWN